MIRYSCKYLTLFYNSGCLNMNDYVKCESKKILTSEIVEYLKKFITRQMLCFMLLLGARTLSNKEIADGMGCKPSALSNLIDRMKKSKIPLISFVRRERYMMYSLTPVALEYIRQYMETPDEHEQKLVRMRDEVQECHLALKRLHENLGDDFESKLILMLLSYINGQYEEEGMEEFCFFMECMKKLIFKNHIREYKEMIHKFASSCLRDKLQNYFTKYIHIRKLCEIHMNDWETAYELVDSYFDSKGKMIGLNVLKSCGEDIGMEEIIGITVSLGEMMKADDEKSLSKEDFRQKWGDCFSGHEQLLYYIAEKVTNLTI